jgi:hypothetical protein
MIVGLREPITGVVRRVVANAALQSPVPPPRVTGRLLEEAAELAMLGSDEDRYCGGRHQHWHPPRRGLVLHCYGAQGRCPGKVQDHVVDRHESRAQPQQSSSHGSQKRVGRLGHPTKWATTAARLVALTTLSTRSADGDRVGAIRSGPATDPTQRTAARLGPRIDAPSIPTPATSPKKTCVAVPAIVKRVSGHDLGTGAGIIATASYGTAPARAHVQQRKAFRSVGSSRFTTLRPDPLFHATTSAMLPAEPGVRAVTPADSLSHRRLCHARWHRLDATAMIGTRTPNSLMLATLVLAATYLGADVHLDEQAPWIEIDASDGRSCGGCSHLGVAPCRYVRPGGSVPARRPDTASPRTAGANRSRLGAAP